MRTFGITVVALGIVACVFAIWGGIITSHGDNQGLSAIAISIAAVGIVYAAAVILKNTGSN